MRDIGTRNLLHLRKAGSGSSQKRTDHKDYCLHTKEDKTGLELRRVLPMHYYNQRLLHADKAASSLLAELTRGSVLLDSLGSVRIPQILSCTLGPIKMSNEAERTSVNKDFLRKMIIDMWHA
ncbi:hypothetical protein J6590_097291 [Homalodisca vitripennis]|nr:hypothetical protein J6590_097291 [Homalodisca vitripennis]